MAPRAAFGWRAPSRDEFMQDVHLKAALTRNRQDFAAGQTVAVPASLAGKLVDRGRAVLAHSGATPAALPVAARPLALPSPEVEK